MNIIIIDNITIILLRHRCRNGVFYIAKISGICQIIIIIIIIITIIINIIIIIIIIIFSLLLPLLLLLMFLLMLCIVDCVVKYVEYMCRIFFGRVGLHTVKNLVERCCGILIQHGFILP